MKTIFAAAVLIALASNATPSGAASFRFTASDGGPEAHREIKGAFHYGRHGYVHTGLELFAPLDEAHALEMNAHIVQENAHDSTFPSLGAGFLHTLPADMAVHLFSFGYFPVADEHAWAIGLRLKKDFKLDEKHTLTPFISTAFTNTRAIDLRTIAPRSEDHTIVLAGATMACRDHFVGTIFGSQSFYSRDPEFLKTHVDLQEVTRLAPLENVDGFPNNIAGLDLRLQAMKPFEMKVGYAAIFDEGGTRHSAIFFPTFNMGNAELSLGYQLIRGAARNDIFSVNAGYRF